MDTTQYVGIDDHLRTFMITRMNAHGKLLDQQQLPKTTQAMTQFLDSLSPGTHLAIEATGYWMRFAQAENLLRGVAGSADGSRTLDSENGGLGGWCRWAGTRWAGF